MAEYLPLVAKRGDTLRRVLTLTDSSGAPLNLAGASVVCHIRLQGATEDALTPVLAIQDVAAGQVILVLSPAETAGLSAAAYVYEIESAKGSDVSTLAEGVLVLLPDIA